MEYMSALVLTHHILQLILGSFILYKSITILRVKQIVTKATPTMMIYFWFMAVLSAFLIIYCCYTIILWRPDDVILDQILLYFIGIGPWILLIINPVFEFCLCIERCLTIGFPYQYLYQSKKYMAIAAFSLFLIFLVLIVWLNNLYDIPDDKLGFCRFFSCLTISIPKPLLNPFKIFISVINGTAAAILLILIRFKTIPSSASKGRSRNMAILIIILTTVLFEFTPNLIDELVQLISEGQHLNTYIGPYRTTISSFNLSITAYLYAKVFVKPKSDPSSVVQVTPTTLSSQTIDGKKSVFIKKKYRF